MQDKNVLLDFLKMPLQDSNSILDKFAMLPGAVRRGQGTSQFVFIKGRRQNKVLLVAHADTVWEAYGRPTEFSLKIEGDIIFNQRGGLGADDRAGCAMVWLLRDMGHSILITSGEELGGVASSYLVRQNPDVLQEINQHSFVIELDRRFSKEYKCYEVATPEFKKYIETATGYKESQMGGFTDICILCRKICGVNLSVGYYNEHTHDEYLIYSQWQHTLDLCRSWLKSDMPRFSRYRELPSQEDITWARSVCLSLKQQKTSPRTEKGNISWAKSLCLTLKRQGSLQPRTQ